MDATMMLFKPMGKAAATLTAVNEQLAAAGLAITYDDALMLARRRAESLADSERVEFGIPAVVAIAEAIATSPSLEQGNAASMLAELQDAFYALRTELPVDVPDDEIIEALRNCLDERSDACVMAEMPIAEVMAFSSEYVRAMEAEAGDGYRIVDGDGREYTFDPAEWDYDEQADGWDGERWSDAWSD
ncbi:MAG: hypothetical protein J5818_05760 [Eggerthellaceae bacterium]|nr:hypothetical protein [Eggerthellaceae bacterium]